MAVTARQDLIDALIAERFGRGEWFTRADADPGGLAHRAAFAAALPARITCAGCGTRVDADEACPTCRAYRQTQQRRARLRAV